MTDFHPATTAIETIIGPHVRGNPRALCASVATALQHAGLLKPPPPPTPATAADEPPRPVGAKAHIFRGETL